jgi:uncharacterized tellurite resistance protein B-like protein
MAGAKHPASFLSEDERMDYLVAVASVSSADGEIDESELARVRALCDVLDLDEHARKRVMIAAEKPDGKTVERALAALAGRPAMSMSLLTDAIVVAFADDKLTGSEASELKRMAHRLDVTVEDAMLVAKYVESLVLHHGVFELDHLAKELRDVLTSRDADQIRAVASKG